MQVRRLLLLGLCVGAASAAALAEPYWISYEATDRYPEEEGWERLAYGGGAIRSIVDGTLVLDGRASRDIADSYRQDLPWLPEDGELFVAHWRMQVTDVTGHSDSGVCISLAPRGAVLLRCSEDAVYSQLEGQWIATFEPGAFHEFCLTTSDVVDYELFIDGQPVHVGEFRGPVSYRDAFWGDQVQGTSSLSTWDFVRFAVVPEPAGWLLLGFGGLLAVKHKPG